MKVWASASAIGLSMAYFATACSSEPPSDNTFQNTSGAPNNTAGTTSMAGNTATGGTPAAVAGNGTGGGAAGTAGASMGSGAPGECPPNVTGHCKAGETYPAIDGYTLALVEDFEAPIDLNTDPIWTWSDGSPQDGQTAFREEQIKFEGGYMTITAESPCAAKTTNSGCVAGYDSHGEALAPNPTKPIADMGVSSGELRTKYNNYRYGRYEAKFAAPKANPANLTTTDKSGGSGNFLSTMFIFRTPKNIDWNEIDIELEPWTSNAVAGNVVSKLWPPNTMQVVYPATNASDFNVPQAAGFSIYDEHVYAFDWTPTKIEWFVDGVSIRVFEGTANVPIPTQSAKIMMNLWIFSGTAFGDALNNTYPFTAKYDWFRFYKLNSEATYPCSPTPGCLAPDDKIKSSQNNPKEANYGL
jgi:hypothetical protein